MYNPNVVVYAKSSGHSAPGLSMPLSDLSRYQGQQQHSMTMQASISYTPSVPHTPLVVLPTKAQHVPYGSRGRRGSTSSPEPGKPEAGRRRNPKQKAPDKTQNMDQLIEEEEAALRALIASGDESEKAMQAKRKLQNRLAQRRRRKRNTFNTDTGAVHDVAIVSAPSHSPVPLQILYGLTAPGRVLTRQPQTEVLVDPNAIDSTLARRRRKSSDFENEEERREWRRAQNREAKRRYRWCPRPWLAAAICSLPLL